MATDIYVSYVRHDDSEYAVRNFIDTFKRKLKLHTGRADFTIDMDFEEIDDSSTWKIDIAEKTRNSLILLPIISPSYLQDKHCAYEWDLFFEKQKELGETIIFPVEMVELADKETNFNIENKLGKKELERLRQIRGQRLLSWANIKTDEDLAESAWKEFTRRIDVALTNVAPLDQRKSNCHIIHKRIDDKLSPIKFDDVKSLIGKQVRAYPELRPVCVIYTGGTVGFIRQEEMNRNSALIIGDVEDVISFIPKIKELEFDIDFYSYGNPIDSSNITSDDWMTLAEIISELYRYYQGFVILQGANTMAYTASALSFMFYNLSKPIILTGAEIPLAELNSDAEQNILRSIQVAAPDLPSSVGNIPEVCILYGNSLIRGNRATKKNSLSTTQGFYSPNYGNLGVVSHDRIALDHRLLRKTGFSDSSNILEIKRGLSKDNIFVLDIYPDMDMEIFHKICDHATLVGLIIRTYGTGNVPDVPREFLDELERLVQKGVIVINLTQCPEGRVELRLFETNAYLFDIGVINGGDMTKEAAYCKLKYLLGNYSNPIDLDTIKQEMQIDLRGELTDSAYSIKYEKRLDVTLVNPIFKGTAKDLTRFDPAIITLAVLRMQGIKITEGSKVSSETELNVKIYFNRSTIDVDGYESEEDLYYQIGSFRHILEVTPPTNEIMAISQNLEVTEKVRRLIRSDTRLITLQVVSTNGHRFTFDSMQLLIFTRSNL